MSLLSHFIFALGYIVISIFVWMMSPSFIENIDPTMAKILGFGVFLFGVQLHITYSFRMNREDVVNRLLALHQDYQVTIDQLEQSKADISALRERVKANEGGHNAEIVNEMRLLQTLLGQVVEKSGKSLSQRLREKGGGEFEKAIQSRMPDKNEDEILNIMHHALEDNRVDLYLQPIVSLPARKVMHYEAYSSVRDDKGEVIFPSQYIKLAEDRGLVSTLDNLLLFRCIQVIRRLGPRQPDMRFFCNISSVSLNDEDFFPQFIDFMLDNSELAGRLVFEFSQQDVLRQPNSIWESLSSLGKRGFRFSMDNVTETNNDLSDLAARYFRYIKLNPSILLNGETDIDPADIKESYKRYDIEVIVEKIETDQTLVEILDCEINRGQGYLFGQPVISSDITNKF
jgi:cyclic-di-GMP phosphodiesterase, flagellum assembly factor TipF